jgi:Protoglobin
MIHATEEIPGYAYGSKDIQPSPVSMEELEELKVTVGWTEDDPIYLRLAGDVLEGQTKQIVDHWRNGIIASIPNLARHSQTPEGDRIPEYVANSGERFEQWILDTCRRSYDQDWLNYQMEIARRHTSAMKNKVDGVCSTPYVPLRDILAFVAVINETIKPYLAAKGHSADDVEKMHLAWCRSLQLQIALWTKLYMDTVHAPSEW